MRNVDPRELTHERLGSAAFAGALSKYDTQRRLEVLIDEFLPDDLVGKRVLEVGTGLGFFAEKLQCRGARVTAIDLGENLVSEVRRRVGCECIQLDALGIAEEFGGDCFDAVLSSECIEHTPSPTEALRQMAVVLKPGGYLSISTPNVVWFPCVRVATVLGLRPFDGFENFSSFARIRRVLEGEGVEIIREKGLHLFPFQLNLARASRWCDEHMQSLRSFMINLCVLGRKKPQP